MKNYKIHGWEQPTSTFKQHCIISEPPIHNVILKKSRCGVVKTTLMGLNRHHYPLVQKTPENACKLCKELLVKDGTLDPHE